MITIQSRDLTGMSGLSECEGINLKTTDREKWHLGFQGNVEDSIVL